MAPQPGGRARSVQRAGHTLDNGQHILIGAYRATLELMHIVGADASALLRRLPLRVRSQLVEPLCVAALNTPAAQASARIFLRVLRDALFSGPGSSDLLLPCAPLDALLPRPANAWLRSHGVMLRSPARVSRLQPGARWRLDGAEFDAVLLACSAAEAARLCADIAPDWAATAAALRYEPIVTVYLHCAGARLVLPMMALHADAQAPAQFVFDLGALSGPPGVFAFVISGAAAWVERGLLATGEAVLAQALAAFPSGTWPAPPALLHCAAEKRATFRCTPGLQRPPARIAPGLWAAGDYVAGPYPATLEGAVRSGRDAAFAMQSDVPQCRNSQSASQSPP